MKQTTVYRTRGVGYLALGLVMVMFLFFSGCEELDFPNPNAPVFEDLPVQTLVTGIEAGMRTELAIYLRVVSIVGREAYYFEPADPRYTGELLFATPDPGGFLLNRPWSARYRVVRNCLFLQEKAAQELSGAAQAGANGFAKTIMAYQLLLNLNYTYNNGLQLDFSGSLQTDFASKEASFNFIANLLDEAAADLNNAGDEFPFQLSDGFAGFDTPQTFRQFNRAIRARVAAYMAEFTGDWQAVLNALAESFLDDSAPLNTDLGVYHIYGSGLGDQLNEIFEPTSNPFVKLNAHPSFGTDAEPGDLRFQSKVFQRPEAITFDNLTTDLQVAITSTSTDPIPIIRNEELILLRAEANINLGNLTAAEADINLVREAAGLGPIDINNPPQGTAIDQLLWERRYSLFMEGHRWIDMRRYDKLNELPIDRPATDAILVQMPKPEAEIPGG